MFQRIRGAIDRTIAEEQARQQSLQANVPSRTPSTSARNGNNATGPPKRPRPKKRSPSETRDVTGDGTADTDPAVFEAAFALDDEALSRTSTPNPPTDVNEAAAEGEDASAQKSAAAAPEPAETPTSDSQETGAKPDPKPEDNVQKSEAPPKPVAPPVLPPDVRTKLRKLEKLEATYPELLRSYRIAHSKATSIEPFERALRENTPLTSIKDPEALLEYLKQLTMKGDMVMDELKTISKAKDELKGQSELIKEENAKLLSKITQLEAENATLRESTDAKTARKTGETAVNGESSEDADKSATEDFFSYDDDELPKLQSEVTAKAEQISKLQSEMTAIGSELSQAKVASDDLSKKLQKANEDLAAAQESGAREASLIEAAAARAAEISDLGNKLQKSKERVKELELQIQDHQSNMQGMKTQHETAIEAQKAELSQALAQAQSLESQLQSVKRDLREKQSASPIATEVEGPPASTPSAASKKNKKKKKKGGAGATPAAPTLGTAATDAADDAASSAVDDTHVAELEAEIASLKAEASKQDEQIERLSKKRKAQEDLQEEIDTLRDELLDIGQGHVASKDQIKNLLLEKEELNKQIQQLQDELKVALSNAGASTELQSSHSTLQKEFEDLQSKSTGLRSDLGAAQQLAQTRFKDLTDLRETMLKLQPELKSLRQDATDLKAAKEELQAKAAELRTLEKREKDLKNEVTRAQKLASDKEAEFKSTQDKLSTETNTRVKLEDANRVLGRDLRRSEAEKIEMSAKSEKAARELTRLQEEATTLRPRVQSLQDEVTRLQNTLTTQKADSDLRQSQYTNAQNLLASMRDQTHELTVQLRESQSQTESLDEELAECRKLLGERTRDGETMRRLLADVDERADTKLRDMRTRLDAAIEERDRLEDESSSSARRKARELEEVRSRLRDMEREHKTLRAESEDFAEREKAWKKRRDELESVEARADAEVEEMRGVVANLKSALDASESQVRDTEKARVEARKMLDELRIRYEKVAKESKVLQAKLSSGNGAVLSASTGRTSMESTRSSDGRNGSISSSGGGGGAGEADVGYIKTILLQFLEQKDNRMRAQLVPVLGKLLRFDKGDEKKWMAAIQHIGAK